jgi:hypothetical protein
VVIGGGYIKFARFAVVHKKITGLLGRATKPRPKMGRGYLAKTGLTGSFEAEDTRRERKAYVEATRSAVAGHPSDGATKTNSKSALGGRVS